MTREGEGLALDQTAEEAPGLFETEEQHRDTDSSSTNTEDCRTETSRRRGNGGRDVCDSFRCNDCRKHNLFTPSEGLESGPRS
jgi:hypothetical protein